MTVQTNVVAIAVSLVVFSGCSSEPPERVWWQPGYTVAQFAIDRDDCWALAREQVNMPTPTYADVKRKKSLQRKFVIGCMYTKGYRQYQRDELGPYGAETLEI